MERFGRCFKITDFLVLLSVLLLGGGLFFSCDAASGFLLDVDEELTIETIVPGAILQTGDEVPINLEFNESVVSPDYLEVQFLSKEGESLGKFELEYRFRSNGSFPTPIVAESLEPGEYILKFLIKEGTTVLSEKEIAFFLVDRDVRILSVNTTPSQVKPGSDVMLSVNLSGEATGYFIRWKFKERILKEDFLEKGGDKVTFKAPGLEGIYVVRVEIFPGEVDSSVNSSVYSIGEILVTEDPLDDSYELTGEEDFTLLYHFAGDLKNSAKGTDNQILSRSEGRFIPMQKEGSFGYLFNKESRLVAPYTAFPTNLKGEMESFAVCGQIAPYRVSKGGTLFFMEDGKGETSLNIAYNGTGRLTAVFSESGEKSALSLPLRADEKLSWVVLSVIFSDNRVTLSWYIDGKLKSTSVFSAESPVATEGGTVVLGDPDGEDKTRVGFTGFIGDWGIYKISSTTSEGAASGGDLNELLNRIVRLIYRDRLIYFNSFDNPADGKSINFQSRLKGKNTAQINRGKLLLTPGSSLSIAPFTPKEGKTRIIVESASLSNPANNVFLRFWSADSVGERGSLYYETPLNPEGETTEAEIVVDQSGKTVIFQTKETEKEKREWEIGSVVCTIEHENTEGTIVELDTVMVVTE